MSTQEQDDAGAVKSPAPSKTMAILKTIGSYLWLAISIIIFPIGLVRVFLYADQRKTDGSFPDRFFFRPIWYVWDTFLKGIWKVFWILFCIIVFPVGLFYVGRWIITGSAKQFWGNFGSFLIGSWSRSGGVWNWMRFVSVPDVFHFHILSWPLSTLAVVQWYIGTPQQWVGITFILLHILAVRTFFRDVPLQRFLLFVFIGIPLILLADNGVKLCASNLWPHIEGMTIPIVGLSFPQEIPYGRGGFIVPTWNWLTGGKLLIESWMLFVYSLLWWWFVVQVIIYAAFNRRVELDARTVFIYRWGEAEDTDPVYMRSSQISFPDIFEAILSGSGDLVLDTRKGKRRFKNVLGLVWLQFAYNGLRNSKTVQERKAEQLLSEREDEAELVEEHQRELEAAGHAERATSDDDDHEEDAFGKDFDEDDDAEAAEEFFDDDDR